MDNVHVDAQLEHALTLARSGACAQAMETLVGLWREVRDGELSEQICEVSDALVPTSFSLSNVHWWTVQALQPSGALLQAIVAHLRGLVAHDASIEAFLTLVLAWQPDPRLANLAIWVLAQDSGRPGARRAAAELFLKNADQQSRGKLARLAETTLPVLRSEVAAIVERCRLAPARDFEAPQLQKVQEVARVIHQHLGAARDEVVATVNLEVERQLAVEAQVRARSQEKAEKKAAQLKGMRAELGRAVDRTSLAKAAEPTLPRLQAVLGATLKERTDTVWRFEGVDALRVGELVRLGALTLDDAPNGQPSVVEFLGFLSKWPDVRAHGSVFPKECAARLEGLHFEGVVSDALKKDFKAFCHDVGPDELVCTKKRLRSWWD